MPVDFLPTTTLWSLRPAGEHAALRAAAQAAGLPLRVLPVQRLRGREGPSGPALACALRIATSPAAVRFALPPGEAWPRHGRDLAVGSGTAEALRRRGALDVRHPARMDSEGLLACPDLQDVAGRDIGLLSAPGGRGAIAAALEARGARLQLAEVYERVALPVPARRLAAFVADPGAVLLASSGEALRHLVERLPPPARRRVAGRPLVVSSARLADVARGLGWAAARIADGPRAAALVAAAKP